MDDPTRMRFAAQLERNEGRRKLAYRDDFRKIWTIGVGHNMESTPLTDHAIDVIRDDDIEAKEQELVAALPWTTTLPPARFCVLLDMAFNLGVHGLLEFRQMLGFVLVGNWDKAADAMRDSKWAGQVGARATRLERQMLTGDW